MKRKLAYAIAAYQSGDYHDILKLREDAMRKPLGLELSERDTAEDPGAVHAMIKLDGGVVATAQLRHIDKIAVKMLWVAVYPRVRGIGLGKRIVRYCEGYAAGRGYGRIELDARESAMGFYNRLGYQGSGNPYMQSGTSHIFMSKRLV